MRMFITITILLGGIAYAEKFSAGLNIGYASLTQSYNTEGNVQDIGGTYSILNFGLNVRYYILSPEIGPKVYLGTKFNFSQHQISLNVGNSISSGFSPQHLNLLLGGSYLFVNGFLGFQLDLGPKPDLDKWVNSDRQNAILFGIGANIPFMAGLGDFHANLSYALTLEKEENTKRYDEGDILLFVVGGGYKFGISEVASLGFGLDFIYRLKTEEKKGNNTVSNSSSSNFSIMPYLKYKTGPISAWVKLGAADEYGYYGFSLMGKNSFVTRLGVTAGLSVSY